MPQQNDYQFVMIPQQLSSCLDANCNKMLTTLLGLSSILANEDGWFYRSNKDLQLDSRFSQNLVIATLDTLYQAGIINIDSIGKGRGHRTNRIHINFESFKVYQQYSFNDIRNNPDLWIETVHYKNHYTPSYSNNIGKEKGNRLGKGIGKKVTTITDTTDTSNISNTIDNNIINNIEDIECKKVTTTQDISFEEFSNMLKSLCMSFIRKHQDYNYLLDEETFKEYYYDNVLRFRLFINEQLNRDISIEDCCIMILAYANQEERITV